MYLQECLDKIRFKK